MNYDDMSLGDVAVFETARARFVGIVREVDRHPSGQIRCIVIDQYPWSFIGREPGKPIGRSAVGGPGVIRRA